MGHPNMPILATSECEGLVKIWKPLHEGLMQSNLEW